MSQAVCPESAVLVGRCAVWKDIISYNVSQGAHRYSVNKSHKQTREWAKLLRSTDGLGFEVLQKQYRRRVLIRRVLRGRMKPFERVNLFAAAKPLEDALVKLNWLIDDAEKYCDLQVQQPVFAELDLQEQREIEKRNAKILVSIYDLTGEPL
jgi:hypothetical protein